MLKNQLALTAGIRANQQAINDGLAHCERLAGLAEMPFSARSLQPIKAPSRGESDGPELFDYGPGDEAEIYHSSDESPP